MAVVAKVEIMNTKKEVVWRVFADENDNIVFEYAKNGKADRRFLIDKDGGIHRITSKGSSSGSSR